MKIHQKLSSSTQIILKFYIYKKKYSAIYQIKKVDRYESVDLHLTF